MKPAAHHDDLPHLRRRAGLGHGLREVTLACLAAARAGQGRPTASAVHRARRALKRVRAVLRLGQRLGVPGAKALRGELTREARELSPLRDAAVVAKLARRCDLSLSPASKAPGPQEWREWKRKLAELSRQLARLPWGQPAPHALERALRHFARGAQRCARRAISSGKTDAAHEWRKAAIVLRELVLTLRPLLGRKADDLHAALQAVVRPLGKAMDWEQLLAAAGAQGAKKKTVPRARKKRKRALHRARKCWRQTRDVLAENGLA